MTSESLVIIRTYDNLTAADLAQVELLSAGIYSLALSDDRVALHPGIPGGSDVALAVHRRDAEIAEAVLAEAAGVA